MTELWRLSAAAAGSAVMAARRNARPSRLTAAARKQAAAFPPQAHDHTGWLAGMAPDLAA